MKKKDFRRHLWSINSKKIDFEKDRYYIIHQILAWGEPEDLKFLFKTYGFDVVKKIFLSHPKKIYTYPAISFLEILFGKKLDKSRYVSHII